MSRIVSPNSLVARELLDSLWKQVLAEEQSRAASDIDLLIASDVVSIRFCLPTQLLGKLTDPNLDCLCLQKGNSKLPSAWDPRGFCSKVIVPWMQENHSVLGTSSDPYVSKPLRRIRLDVDQDKVKNQKDWELLLEVLSEVENRSSPEFTKSRFLDVLRSIYTRVKESSFDFVVPERISLAQTVGLVKQFLTEGSGGDRGLAIAAALFETLGFSFGLFSEVRRHAINSADAATGSSGDLECFDAKGDLKLSVEVKERMLTLTDVRSGVLKARKGEIREMIFNAPGTVASDDREIAELIEKTWASGTNLYRLAVEDLLTVGLTLAGEESRTLFLKNVGEQLNRFNTQPKNRIQWRILLESI